MFAPAITETGMGMLLCLTRGITRLYMPQFAKRQMNPVGTAKSPDHVELAGKTMGIVGMGGIGSALARRAHYGFDMRIVATDARPVPQPHYVAELRDPSWFKTMVPHGGRARRGGAAYAADRADVRRERVSQHEEDRVFSGAVTRHAVR